MTARRRVLSAHGLVSVFDVEELATAWRVAACPMRRHGAGPYTAGSRALQELRDREADCRLRSSGHNTRDSAARSKAIRRRSLDFLDETPRAGGQARLRDNGRAGQGENTPPATIAVIGTDLLAFHRRSQSGTSRGMYTPGNADSNQPFPIGSPRRVPDYVLILPVGIWKRKSFSRTAFHPRVGRAVRDPDSGVAGTHRSAACYRRSVTQPERPCPKARLPQPGHSPPRGIARR